MTLIDPQQKLLSRQDAVQRLGRPRTDRLVFTNGVFDILHRGHVAYLYAARALGDRLLVGLNSDASVRRLKGNDRPMVSEEDRAYTLAGLACVDAVTIFDEDTPAALIEAIIPNVLVKGADYAPDQVVGRDVVEANGGRLVLIPLITGRSTTRLIERIRESEA